MKKIVGMEKIHFIIGYGKMNLKKTSMQTGSDFATIEDFGLKIVKKRIMRILKNQLSRKLQLNGKIMKWY